MRKVRAVIAGLLVAAFVLQPGMAALPAVRAEAASTPTPDAVPTAAATATPTTTPSIPNLPSLAAPVVSRVGATFASVTLPAKPRSSLRSQFTSFDALTVKFWMRRKGYRVSGGGRGHF